MGQIHQFIVTIRKTDDGNLFDWVLEEDDGEESSSMREVARGQRDQYNVTGQIGNRMYKRMKEVFGLESPKI